LSEEKKTDWGAIGVLAAVAVGAYLLVTRKAEPAPTAPTYASAAEAAAAELGPTAVTAQPSLAAQPSYQPGQGYVLATNPESGGKTLPQTWRVGEQKPGTVSEPKWTDPTQAPLFHFNKYPAGVEPQPGQIVGVQVPRPWAGVTGEGLFNQALEAPLYWEGNPDTAGLILVPERYREIIEKYGIETLRAMRSPADPAYAEIEAKYGREIANLMIRYALELGEGQKKGYKIEYVTTEHMKIAANRVDERFLNDWILGASITHPQGDPGTVAARASQMGLSQDEYMYIALRYFYELHGYIPDQYKDLWNRLDPSLHDTWKGFPAPYEKTYVSPSGSGEKYTYEQYVAIFGRPPGWYTPTQIRPGEYVWSDPQKPGSILTGSMNDYKKSMADVEKSKTQPEKPGVEKGFIPSIPTPGEFQTKEQKASSTSSIPQAKPLPAEKPPQSTPTNPRATQTTRASVGAREKEEQVNTRQTIQATLERINRAERPTRRG